MYWSNMNTLVGKYSCPSVSRRGVEVHIANTERLFVPEKLIMICVTYLKMQNYFCTVKTTA